MANVKCGACGKRYDYYEHGCCPNCGAYNRPPRRNRVDVDGTVHHISDDEFFSNTAARRRSQGGKVCFEQDECHEAQPRKVRNSPELSDEQRSPFDRVPRNTSRKEKKSHPGRIVAGIIIAVMVGNILPLILTTCSFSDVEDFFDNLSMEPARPEQTPGSVEQYSVEVGGTFVWWDADARVEEVYMNEEETFSEVELVMWRAEDGPAPEMVYQLPDGTVVTAKPDSISVDGEHYFYYYFLTDRAVDSECYVLFAGYTDNVYCELTLPLVESGETAVISYESMESTFLWWDAKTVVTGADIVESGSATEMQVIVVQTGEFDEPAFLYYTEEGWESLTYCQEIEDLGQGKFRYTFYVEDRMPGSDCWAVFSGYNEDTFCEVRVLLPGVGETPSREISGTTAAAEEIRIEDMVWETAGNTTKLEVVVQQNPDAHFTMPTLRYTDKKGVQQEAEFRSYTMQGSGAVTYNFRVKNMDLDAGCSLCFADHMGLQPSIVIPLN